MQGLILAAGRGTRLGALTKMVPKCMITINGYRLIELMLARLDARGIDRVVLVVGHAADTLRTLLGEKYRGVRMCYVVNPLYATTNNISSLLLAGSHLAADDTVLIESDLIFEQSVLDACLDDPAPDVAVVARYQHWMDGTVVTIDDDGCITRVIGKQNFNPHQADTYFKTVNLYKLSRTFCREFFLPAMRQQFHASGSDSYYEEALASRLHMSAYKLRAVNVSDKRWFEIDTPDDLARAAALFAASSQTVAPSGVW